MRLLKLTDSSGESLTSYLINDIPSYSILSHTWGEDEDEVTFNDLHDGTGQTKAGYHKIAFCATRARKDELQHLWLDTCCIDKANHKELSEAITCMYRWYRDAVKCYVYLSDVSTRTDQGLLKQDWEPDFRASRWFTRGWTLPELIAPATVEFFSKEGDFLGNKRTLEQSIHEITGIPLEVLRGCPLSQFSIADRLKWAEKRETTRKEDKAYSLLGLFDVSIPIIYGGDDNAFVRLRKEIDKSVASTPSPSVIAECMQAFSSEIDCLVQKNRNQACAPETGQWFFGDQRYQNFHAGGASQLLFVTAEAGSGKSTVMRTFIDTLQASRPTPLIAYFFFKDDNDLQRSYSEALSAIIHQVLTLCPALLKHVTQPVQRYGAAVKHETGELWRILTEFGLYSQDDIVCVLDAVDECDASGRTQLLRDLKAYFQNTISAMSRLKFVVSSRPYQDQTHSYKNLVSCSPKVIHLDGENAKFEADIARVVNFKVDDLIRKRKLSDSTRWILYDRILTENAKTKSFLWVKLAFELLNTDPRLRQDADEPTVNRILAAIPESIAELFECLLQSSLNPDHARKILSVVLTARRPLKIGDLKVVYRLTQSAGDGLDPPRTYDDIDLLQDDGDFKTLVRNTCGLFITFVKKSVHLFHQTAREYLMPDMAIAQSVATYQPQYSAVIVSVTSENEVVELWKHSITLEEANSVTARVCLDLLSFDASEEWVLSVFAKVNCRDAVQEYCSRRPFLMYAACNWWEHLTLSGDSIHRDYCTQGKTLLFDLSKTQFWVWFLIACDQVCLSGWIKSAPYKDEPVAKVWADVESFGRMDRGVFLRTMCLQKMCSMDDKVSALFFDDFTLIDVSNVIGGLFWTATGGYRLIDEFHLANGDWKNTSMSKAISALVHGDESATQLLVEDIPLPTLIWASIKDDQLGAFRYALALATDLNWLDVVPEYIFEYGGQQPGLIYSTEPALDPEGAQQQESDQQYPDAFEAIIRANALPSGNTMFGVLADWLERSPSCQAFAEKLWKAGGFINSLLCRRLLSSGVQLEISLWRDQVTALQVAANFWEHDALENLLASGADALAVSHNGYNALHWFCFAQDGPTKEEFPYHLRTTRGDYHKIFSYRREKVQIKSSLKSLIDSVPDKESLIHKRDADGITPLMLSVQFSSTITRCLLEEGIMVDQRDGHERTALMHFFLGSNYLQRRQTILENLLLSGADARLCDISGITAVGYWVQQLTSQSLSHLYAGYNAHNINFHALNALGILSRADGMADCLKPLHIPLAAAVKLGNAELCRYLLSGGASANEHGINDNSPMARNDGSEASNLEEMSWNPLMIAIHTKAYTTAALLLDCGANVNFRISELKCTDSWNVRKIGTTPLHFVVANGPHSGASEIYMATSPSSGGCMFELAGHPDRKISRESGWEQLARMCRQSYPKREDEGMEESDDEMETMRGGCVNESRGSNLLPFDKFDEEMSPGAKDRDSLFDMIYDNHSTRIRKRQALTELLLRRGVDSNARTQECITPLLICAQNGQTDLATILLDYGADPNAATSTGFTALMWAARNGDRDMAELLISRGADVNCQPYPPDPNAEICERFETRDGWPKRQCLAPITPLALAAERGHFHIVELLLERNADPNLKIVHHAHGLPRAKDGPRRCKFTRKYSRLRRRREAGEFNVDMDSDTDSEPEPEEWKGYWSVATALTWSRGEIRDLMLRYGAEPAVEEPIRECGCVVEKGRVEDDPSG